MHPRLVRARLLAPARAPRSSRRPLAVTVGVSPAAVRTALAADPLRIAADATYVLDPGDGRVHVAIDFELTNLKPNSATTVYYYSSYLTAIHPDAVGLRVTDASGALSITTNERRFFTRLEVHLRNFLYYNESTRFTVRYDLRGGAPRSESWVRVSRAFATFGVWAWGDSGRSTVEVRLPAGYETTVDGDQLRIDSDGPGEVLTAEPDRPNTFYAIVSAENRAAYTSTRLSLEGDIELVLLAWPEDRRWEETATETLRTGLPELVDLIGLPWPVNHDLEVRERFTPALEGYAGVFFTLEERIELSEDLDPLTTMHEASHAWFNDALFAERWIYEGLAEEYAWRVQKRVGGSSGFGPLEPDADDPGHIALDRWTFPQVIRDQETDDRERYGYEASFWVIHTIVAAAGVEHMQTAYASADDNRTAYVGAAGPEMVAVVDDWHRFLDLAQPIDQPDSPEVAAAITELVLGPGQSADLDQRHDARERYRELVAAGEGWLPPWLVRRPMGTWTFSEAMTAMDDATTMLQQRDEIQAAAAALGLTPDDGLKTAYETRFGDLRPRNRRRSRRARSTDRDRRRESQARRAARPRLAGRADRGGRARHLVRRGPCGVRERRAGRSGRRRCRRDRPARGRFGARPAAPAHRRRGSCGAAHPRGARRRTTTSAPTGRADARDRGRRACAGHAARGRCQTRRRAAASLARVAARGSPARARVPATRTGVVAAHEGVARSGAAGPLRYTRHRSGQPFAADRAEIAGPGGRRFT